jgi:hypothetical protein
MSIVSRTGDLFYAYRFIKLLVTDWDKTDAYKLGIVDEDGKVLKKSSQLTTPDEKSAYTVFHRLVFNIKRLLNKLPFGRTKLASWATALFLIKEETGMSEEAIMKVLKKVDVNFDDTLSESTWYMAENNVLHPGVYTLQYDVMSPKTGEAIAQKNSKVMVHKNCIPVGESIGTPIYEVTHIRTQQKIFINPGEIKR